MNAAVVFLKTLGPARLGALAAVTASLLGFFIFIILRLSQPQMVTLYSGLSLEDSSSIITQLDSMNVPYKLRSDGAVILVPKQNVLRLRMKMAEEGIPTGGSIGYEIFDKSSGLGTTSFVENINRIRALEGELARTIRSLSRVKMARVHLVMPEKQLFSRSKTKPSASIVLKMSGGINPGQVRAIQHLTASAVEGLDPERVSIVDETGRMLADGGKGAEGIIALNSMEERKLKFQKDMQEKVSAIVSSIVGANNARVQVAAELDFNRITEVSNVFDPDGQVVRSTSTRENNTSSLNRSNDKTVSVGNELPSADTGEKNGGAKSSENSNNTEETVNYEISNTRKTKISEMGRLVRLSVAVLVDGTYTKDAKGNITYTPRPKEELDQIAVLVRSAVGFNRERGDVVEVVNLRFAPDSRVEKLDNQPQPFLGLTKDDYFEIGQIAALFLFALLVLLFVVRPLVRRIITPDETQEALASGTSPGGQPLTGPDGEPLPVLEGGENTREALTQAEATNSVTEFIDLAKVAGSIQENSVRKVGELVQNNPTEALTIIRQWINEPA